MEINMDDLWKAESERYKKMPKDQQVFWLARVVHLVTMYARDCYASGDGSVSDPMRLKNFNEAVHRIVSHQVSTALGSKRRGDDELFKWLVEVFDFVKVNRDFILKDLQIHCPDTWPVPPRA